MRAGRSSPTRLTKPRPRAGRFSILPGGLPISLDGTVVAGIGVSGAPTGEIDASCAADSINAIS
jgi:uncharacterized protein GlcG (DUF336 family)